MRSLSIVVARYADLEFDFSDLYPAVSGDPRPFAERRPAPITYATLDEVRGTVALVLHFKLIIWLIVLYCSSLGSLDKEDVVSNCRCLGNAMWVVTYISDCENAVQVNTKRLSRQQPLLKSTSREIHGVAGLSHS